MATLVAHYTFDGNTLDQSGNGLDATAYGDTSYTDGVSGQAVYLDGSGDYLQTSNLSDQWDAWSISAFVKADSLSNYMSVIEREIIGKFNDTELFVHPTGQVQVEADNSVGGPYQSSEFIVADEWFHLATTFDGSNINLYINGNLDSSYSASNASVDVVAPLLIGKHSNASYPNYFHGAIDEVKVYDGVLTLTEIATEASALQTDPELIAHYTFNNTFQDDSGNSHHGTESGGVSFATGVDGQAASFDGSSTYLDTTFKPQSLDGFAVSVWFKPSQLGNDGYIFGSTTGIGDADKTSMALRLLDDGRLLFATRNSDSNNGDLYSPAAIDADTWHHAVVQYTGDSVQIILNNELIVEGSQSGIFNAQHDIAIGARRDKGNIDTERVFDGIIDEVRFYSSALSAQEISDLYDAVDLDDNSAPEVIQPLDNETYILGEVFSYSIPSDVIIDPDGDSLTYSVKLDNGNDLPNWMYFNPATMTINGIAEIDELSSFDLEFTASDGEGLTASDEFTLHFIPDPDIRYLDSDSTQLFYFDAPSFNDFEIGDNFFSTDIQALDDGAVYFQFNHINNIIYNNIFEVSVYDEDGVELKSSYNDLAFNAIAGETYSIKIDGVYPSLFQPDYLNFSEASAFGDFLFTAYTLPGEEVVNEIDFSEWMDIYNYLNNPNSSNSTELRERIVNDYQNGIKWLVTTGGEFSTGTFAAGLGASAGLTTTIDFSDLVLATDEGMSNDTVTLWGTYGVEAGWEIPLPLDMSIRKYEFETGSEDVLPISETDILKLEIFGDQLTVIHYDDVNGFDFFASGPDGISLETGAYVAQGTVTTPIGEIPRDYAKDELKDFLKFIIDGPYLDNFGLEDFQDGLTLLEGFEQYTLTDSVLSYGDAYDTVYTSTAAAESFVGDTGLDLVSFTDSFTNYSLLLNEDNTFTINSFINADDIDTLTNIERLQFSDTNIALDIDGANSAGGIYRTYQAAFDRTPDSGGFGYWIDRADEGATAVEMAEEFVWSSEFQSVYGVTTTDNYLSGNDIESVVDGFYRNVLGRDPDQGGLDFYSGVIEAEERTVGRVLAEIA
ncbi:MAG: LamG-like jellyroll fold domain-containing protein, partial [Neptuniibacter sp.]